MTDVMIEQLGAVSLRNGVVRVETKATGADGEVRTTGELVIPASQFGSIAAAMQQAGQDLRQKLEQAQGQQEEQH